MIESIGIDSVVAGPRGRYRVVAHLGGGKYAEVWKAEVAAGDLSLPAGGEQRARLSHVALKVPNRQLSPEELRRFWSERDTLSALQLCERELGLQVAGCSLLPAVVDVQDRLEPYFMAQTLAPGEPLDELLRERGALPEAQALIIVGQFCRVLQTLHQGLHRSYLDFQPRNIFWDQATGRIMVIDWNLLGDYGEAQAAGDVSAAVALLYQALLGVRAPAPGSPRRLAQPAEQWAALSLGTQQLLTRAFHIDPQRHFTSAAELRADIERLGSYWQACAGDSAAFVQGVEALLPSDIGSRTLGDSDRALAAKAAVMLSVAEKAGAWLPPGLKDQTAAWLTGRGHLENGIAFVGSLDYTSALAEFQLAVEEAWDRRVAVQAMRWAQLVQAARTLSQHHYRRLDWSAAHRALELAEQERYAEAGRVVEELDRDGQTDALGALAAELRLCTLLNQARQFESQEQYPEAESAAAQAAQALQQLPASYRALLLEELGDLPGWLERLHQQALAAREAEQTLGEMERSFERSFQEGYAHLEDTFRQQPSQVAAARRALHWAEQYLKQEAYAQADAVAGLGLDYVARPRERQRLLQVWQLARGMERLQEVWQRRAWPEAPQLADELRAAQPAAAVCLETFAAGHFDRAHLEGDYAAARTAYELLGTEARASRQAQSEQLARQHDQDLAQQRAQIGAALEAAGQAAELDPNAPGWAARLAEAVAQLDRALALAKETGVAQDEQDRLQTLRADIEARQAALEQARAAYRTNREQLVAHLWVLLSPGQPALHGAAATSLANPIGLPAIYQRRLWQTVRDAARDLLTVLPADAERLRWETWRDAADQALQQFELQEPDRAPAPEGVSHPQPAEPVPGAPDHPPAASRPAVQSRLSAGAAGDSRRLVALLGIGLAVLVLQLLVILILLMQG